MEKKRTSGLPVVSALIIVSNLISLVLLIKFDTIVHLLTNNFASALSLLVLHPFLSTFCAGFPMLGTEVLVFKDITIGLHTLLLILAIMILFLKNLARKLFIMLQIILLLLGLFFIWLTWWSPEPKILDAFGVFAGGFLVPAGYIFYFTRPKIKERFK